MSAVAAALLPRPRQRRELREAVRSRRAGETVQQAFELRGIAVQRLLDGIETLRERLREAVAQCGEFLFG